MNAVELISGKEALIALANGKELQQNVDGNWVDIRRDISWRSILGEAYKLRLKPRTISINGIEVPAPFEPKEGEDCRCYYISTTFKHGFDWYHSSHHKSYKAAWRTEEEIKQVVSALRNVLGAQP